MFPSLERVFLNGNAMERTTLAFFRTANRTPAMRHAAAFIAKPRTHWLLSFQHD
jgi:hypothetical protein